MDDLAESSRGLTHWLRVVHATAQAMFVLADRGGSKQGRETHTSSQLWKRRSRTSGGTHCVILLFASSRSLNAVTRTNQLGVACVSSQG